MKSKVIIGIVIVLCVSLIIGVYIGKSENNKNESKEDTKKSNIIENGNEESNDNSTNNKEEKKEYFRGTSFEKWKNLVSQFYNNHYDYVPDDIIAYYDKEGHFFVDTFVQIDEIENEMTLDNSYMFDPAADIATDKYGATIDFILGKFVECYSYVNLKFDKDYVMAIGYLPETTSDKFIKKYFYSKEDYSQLPQYDERKDLTSEGNKFVIIPKTNFVTISVYECTVSEDGQMKKGRIICSESQPFILYDDYVEVIPHLCIEFKYNDVEGTFPILFSGEDGTLSFTDFEKEVNDISIYEAEQ